MIYKQNLQLKKGQDGVFEIPLSFLDGRALDISAPNSVRVDVYSMGAYEGDAPVLSIDENSGSIQKVTETGAVVVFRFRITASQSAAMAVGDYRWVEIDLDGGLKTATIGGVLTVG